MHIADWESSFGNSIQLPGIPELQERLRQKLAEYRKRIAGYKEQYRSEKLGVVVDRDNKLLDALYKSEVVEALLEKGAVNIGEVRTRIAAEFGGYVSEEVFHNAVSVINDYIKTGGTHTTGGSGFFTDEMFQQLLGTAQVLEYPEDAVHRAELQNRYYEYLGRTVDAGQRADATVDRAALKRNQYKVRLLTELQEHRRIVIPELARILMQEDGGTFHRMEFYNAVCQIRDLLKGLK